uniref:Uncharacterized protein n=1 Tax=Arundo donax TaxID=35708 RepID=A0A0A9DQ06_ARUDO
MPRRRYCRLLLREIVKTWPRKRHLSHRTLLRRVEQKGLLRSPEQQESAGRMLLPTHLLLGLVPGSFGKGKMFLWWWSLRIQKRRMVPQRCVINAREMTKEE